MKVNAGISNAFADTVVEIDVGLKIVLEAGADLLAALPKAASVVQHFDDEAFAALSARRLVLQAQQKSYYRELASQVAKIGALVEDEREKFDRREHPLLSDVFLGIFSKKSMRRRIERRAARTGGIERLRIGLGRADRLSGVIEGHRQAVMDQRTSAEDALSVMAGFKNSGEAVALNAGATGTGKAVQEPALESVIGLIDPVARAFNGGVRDMNLLLQKLSFDIESLLDLYSVLLSFDREREVHCLSLEAYPHLAQPVWRLGNGLLPGARLERIRQRTDSAFAKRFEDA